LGGIEIQTDTVYKFASILEEFAPSMEKQKAVIAKRQLQIKSWRIAINKVRGMQKKRAHSTFTRYVKAGAAKKLF
jgi:hypothetical protein